MCSCEHGSEYSLGTKSVEFFVQPRVLHSKDWSKELVSLLYYRELTIILEFTKTITLH
jgi:hypothetical protein